MTSRLADFIRDRAAETYPEPRHTSHDEITAKMAAIVAPLLPAGGKILDIGCGQGPALEWFSKAGFDVTGITTNGDDLRACEAAGFHEVYPCDMHDVAEQFSEGEFDCVWARHVLEHSVAPFFALHEFARALKPGGILYVETPSPDTACAHEANGNHYSVLGSRAWTCLIQRAGFEIHEARNIALTTAAGADNYFSFICRKTSP